MKKFLTLSLGLASIALLGAACGPAPMAAEAPLEEPAAQAPSVPSVAEFTVPQPTPTETPLTPLTLPTPLATPPAFQNWDGAPTYPAESLPDAYFRVQFDPRTWALTKDQFGQTVLAHRQILNCIIGPAVGRGLPLTVRVEHDYRKIGALDFEINTAYEGDEMKFVAYLGGDANIYTGFQVSFDANADACLSDAEKALATLTSINKEDAGSMP